MPSAEITFHVQINQYENQLSQLPELEQAGLLQSLIIEPLALKAVNRKGVKLSVLRSDLLHPVISGNKWFKLKYNLLAALNIGGQSVVSFGGAWSNHLHALAYAGRMLGLETLGIIRGEELNPESNVMLKEAKQQGMNLRFVSREDYRNESNKVSWQQIQKDHSAEPEAIPSPYYIPEGGDNEHGMLGASTLLNPELLNALAISHVISGVGTGCTFAGLRLSAPGHIKLVGISALKGDWVKDSMISRLQRYQCWLSEPQQQNWLISTDYHRGGFGRVDECLLSFIREFADNTGLQLEPLYTGKAMMALIDQVEQQVIPSGSHVLFVHSGGLQGNRGFEVIK